MAACKLQSQVWHLQGNIVGDGLEALPLGDSEDTINVGVRMKLRLGVPAQAHALCQWVHTHTEIDCLMAGASVMWCIWPLSGRSNQPA